jgi:hypothetical protein
VADDFRNVQPVSNVPECFLVKSKLIMFLNAPMHEAKTTVAPQSCNNNVENPNLNKQNMPGK